MIDTHAHLQFPKLLENIEEIISESKKAGVTGVVIASSNISDSKKAVELAKKYPGFLFASVGIHPQKTDPENKAPIKDQLSELESLIKESIKPKILNSKLQINPKDQNLNNQKNCGLPLIVAIGETGLDFSEPPPGEEKRSKEEQFALFKGQIDLAQKCNLPLIIHAREAIDEVIKILSHHLKPNTKHPRGVFHCYSGGKKRIQKILDIDSCSNSYFSWYFGFDGNITYDEGLQNIIKIVPEDRILIETDSPYLTPIPHRGKTNIPAFLPLINKTINKIFNKDLTEQIIDNTKRVFNFNKR